MASQRNAYDDDRNHFPLLQSISADIGVCCRLKPQDMDVLGVEITKAFQRCSVPEADTPIDERIINALMLGCIGTIDEKLSQESSRSAEVGALLVLYRRVILTPVNLTALFRMCDPKIRTGMVNCHAIWHLRTLMAIRSIWSMKLEDGTSFAMAIIRAMATLLDPNSQVRCAHPRHKEIPWAALGEALGICSDSSNSVVDLLLTFPWPEILQREDAFVSILPCGSRTHWNMVLFSCLHHWAVRLLREDISSKKAKALLKQLGACSILLTRTLQSVVSGEFWSPNEIERFDDLAPVVKYLLDMMNCLVPVPDDNEIDMLVRKARFSLEEQLMASMLFGVAHLAKNEARSMRGINATNICLTLLEDEHWQGMKQESDQSRWKRFCEAFLTGAGDAERASKEDFARTLKRQAKKSLKENANLSEGEMCANCFILEAQLQSGEKLKKCKRCHQIKYCSRYVVWMCRAAFLPVVFSPLTRALHPYNRDCQVEHWKKIHKKQCKAV